MIAPYPLTGTVGYITAWLDNSRTDIEKVFRCNACGAPLFKYYDSLTAVIPGKMLDINGSVIMLQCHGRYEFVATIGKTIAAQCKTEYWIYR